jgi:hypothetical protein
VVLWLVSDDKQIHDAGKVTVVKHKLDLRFLFFGVCWSFGLKTPEKMKILGFVLI